MSTEAMWRLIEGDCMAALPTLEAGSVQTCITSPPYWGLRSYTAPDSPLKAVEVGSEMSPEEYVARLVLVFREVRRVLADDGTLVLNLGDTFMTKPMGSGSTHDPKHPGGRNRRGNNSEGNRRNRPADVGLKHKDLVGVPWLVAFALQRAGWWLRMDCVWHKTNAMPEPATDRPTKSHEYVFLLSRSATYRFDHEAMMEPAVGGSGGSCFGKASQAEAAEASGAQVRRYERPEYEWRNRRSVFSVPVAKCEEAHFAVMPDGIVEPFVLACSRPGDVVLDPFAGAGTVLRVAVRHGRKAVGVELNPDFGGIIRRRMDGVAAPLFEAPAEATPAQPGLFDAPEAAS